jgi:hypothetical protein
MTILLPHHLNFIHNPASCNWQIIIQESYKKNFTVFLVTLKLKYGDCCCGSHIRPDVEFGKNFSTIVEYGSCLPAASLQFAVWKGTSFMKHVLFCKQKSVCDLAPDSRNAIVQCGFLPAWLQSSSHADCQPGPDLLRFHRGSSRWR